MSDRVFKRDIELFIASVPAGKVVSYGQVAALCGHPGAARVVGQIAHFGPPDLPWHRLVHSSGAMARGFVPGGPLQQKRLLEEEGVKFKGDLVIMKDFQIR